MLTLEFRYFFTKGANSVYAFCRIRSLLCSFLRSGYPESSQRLLRRWSIDKSRLKIGHYNRQTSMHEALVETLPTPAFRARGLNRLLFS
jgi:hypothetical protein